MQRSKAGAAEGSQSRCKVSLGLPFFITAGVYQTSAQPGWANSLSKAKLAVSGVMSSKLASNSHKCRSSHPPEDQADAEGAGIGSCSVVGWRGEGTVMGCTGSPFSDR